jgi:hypothetical protein
MEFYDINKFPAKEGTIIFPISMSRIDTKGQNAATYMKFIEYINPSKIKLGKNKTKIGARFIYGDFLYLYNEGKASELKTKFMNSIHIHKNNVVKLVSKDPHLIPDAFSFSVWNQYYLENDKFIFYLDKVKKLYTEDKEFQKYLKKDFKNLQTKGKLDGNQINFFLEEHLMVYLMQHQQVSLKNEFIKKEEWTLLAYPGKPLYAQIYLWQLNPFKFKSNNEYASCWYDLEEKKLYDFTKIDLEEF